MCNHLPQRRPNCEEILEKKDLWAQNEENFETNDELEKIIDSKWNGNELTIYCLLRLGLNCDKAQKFY